MTQPHRAGAGHEALLAAHRHLVLEQQAKPLGVLEGACRGVGSDLLAALGHAVQAEGVEEVESRMGEHASSPSVEVAGAAEVGMVDHRHALVLTLGAIEIVGEDGGKALGGERADRDGPGRDGFRPGGIEPAEEPQDP
jgi:hypothetical protein